MFVRIDPSLPIIWRSPRAIQIGVEPARAVLDPAYEREQRMLAAARSGVPSEALPAIGRCSESAARAFLARIRPALEAGRPPSRPAAQVRVVSSERAAIVRSVRSLGLLGDPGARPELGVVIADHAVPLRAYRDWLRSGLPHFAVIFGVETVAVGPVVVPGRTGCLRCADLLRRERDPAWPAIATQLIRMPAASAGDPVVRTEALCAAARLAAVVARGVDEAAAVAGRRFHRSGAREEVRIEVHPDCGCALDLMAPVAGRSAA